MKFLCDSVYEISYSLDVVKGGGVAIGSPFPGYHVSNMYIKLTFQVWFLCHLRLSKIQCSSIGFHTSLMDQG